MDPRPRDPSKSGFDGPFVVVSSGKTAVVSWRPKHGLQPRRGEVPGVDAVTRSQGGVVSPYPSAREAATCPSTPRGAPSRAISFIMVEAAPKEIGELDFGDT